MALFRGQTLHLRSTDQDQSWGTNIRSLISTAGADTNWTTTFTSTTAITQTVNPYTNISNVSTDNRTTLGWALNEAETSTDGMGAISTMKRIIPAGVWSFQFAWTSNAPALLASYTVTVSYHVYRVATGGGTRTLLFSTTASAVTVTLVGGSGDGAVNSTSQPEYIIEPGETIHVAVQINSKATSALLGSTTNTVITCTGATSGSRFVTLPSPGLRSMYLDSNSIVGNTTLTIGILVKLDKQGVGNNVGSLTRLQDLFREFTSAGDGTAIKGTLMVSKSSTGIGDGNGYIALAVGKELDAIGNNISLHTLKVSKDNITAVGDNAGNMVKVSTFLKNFQASGNSTEDIGRIVTFVRSFTIVGNSTIKPRISLDWDDLPDTGGSQIINVYRPLFIFDD